MKEGDAAIGMLPSPMCFFMRCIRHKERSRCLWRHVNGKSRSYVNLTDLSLPREQILTLAPTTGNAQGEAEAEAASLRPSKKGRGHGRRRRK